MNPIFHACPLCDCGAPTSFARSRDRDYVHCDRCDLVFVPRSQHLSPELELTRYRQHRNDPDDAGYRQFLDRLASEIIPHLQSGAQGLDFGSGPGPTLSVMLAERGFDMTLYDPFFAPDATALERDYDFITCTETIEHFANPKKEFVLLNRLLRSGGWLGIMTQRRPAAASFADWWYIRDETHVAFYSESSLRWLADRFDWRVLFPSDSVALFEKGSPS